MCSKSKITSLCIGKFDGVHLAHQKLFSKLERGSGGVLRILDKNPPFLTPNLEEWVDCFIFNLKLSEVRDYDCLEFVQFLKLHFPSLSKVIVGYDFAFGKNRAFTPKDLKSFFEVQVVNEVKVYGISVHTQKILESLSRGYLRTARLMLGRAYSVSGRVIAGQGRGAKECVATLNLEVLEFVLPKNGVYVSLCEFDGMRYASVSFVGHRLSSDGKFAVEVHLLDVSLSNPPKQVKLYFLAFLRENQKFDSLSILKTQIAIDIKKAREILMHS